jgi:hypothetical protein
VLRQCVLSVDKVYGTPLTPPGKKWEDPSTLLLLPVVGREQCARMMTVVCACSAAPDCGSFKGTVWGSAKLML